MAKNQYWKRASIRAWRETREQWGWDTGFILAGAVAVVTLLYAFIWGGMTAVNAEWQIVAGNWTLYGLAAFGTVVLLVFLRNLTRAPSLLDAESRSEIARLTTLVEGKGKREVARDVWASDAVHYIVDREWPLLAHEPNPGDAWPARGPALAALRQAALDGEVTIWGHLKPDETTFLEIKKDFWKTHVFDSWVMQTHGGRARFGTFWNGPQGQSIPQDDLDIFGALMTSRAQVEAKWPPRD